MNFRTRPAMALLWLVVVSVTAVQAQQFGLTQRVANTTLRMPAQPAVFGYGLTNAFVQAGGASVTFVNPMAFATPVGETNRIFILERAGVVAVVTNLAAPTRRVVLTIPNVPTDSENGGLGLAFHPGFATNRTFFVFHSRTNLPPGSTQLYQRLSRFEMSETNANYAEASSEVPLITQLDQAGNHNGGDIQFGPDGYLYVSLGDEGAGNDSLNNSQIITQDFFSGLLRIDVDQKAGSLLPNPHSAINGTNYRIPPDNPFIGVTNFNGSAISSNQVRTEFWAVGLRNPWKFSFDPLAGTLWLSDVGQNAREEIDIITRGGNYGWAYREGNIAGPKTPPVGFTNGISPILDYPRTGISTSIGTTVTGGIVYRGNRISQLTGAYIFSDFNSGNIWAARVSGTNLISQQFLLNQTLIAGFGHDPSNGDVLLANLGGPIRRLVYSTNIVSGAPLPATLEGTGAFTNLTTLTPNPGIVGYDINVPFWSDHALKTRWFSITNLTDTLTFAAETNWSFPAGQVWIKHFELELTNGVPASRKRLETRFLVKNAAGVYGVTYRWGNSTTNATLVGEEGLDETFFVSEAGNIRTQVWHYPGRSECLQCHTPAGGHALGFNTVQLNRDYNYGGVMDNQLRALAHVGYFSTSLPALNSLRALAPPSDATASLEYRVRSYLQANCVQCHQPGGTGLGSWDARFATATAAAGLINGPLNNNLGDPNNQVARPGVLTNSMLLTRLSQPGPLRMPPLASSVLDSNAIQLLTTWITGELPGYQTFTEWQIANFGTLTTPGADPDGDVLSNQHEWLLRTNPQNANSTWSMAVTVSNGVPALTFPWVAGRRFQVEYSDALANPTLWHFLDVPGNQPFYPVATTPYAIDDPGATNAPARFYRLQISEQ